MGIMSPRRAVRPAREIREPVREPAAVLELAWAQASLGRLFSKHRRLQRLDRRHPWLLDTAVVVLVFVLNMPNLMANTPIGPSPQVGSRGDASTGVLYVLALALVVPLWWRRKAPATVFLVISAVSIVEWSLKIWQYAGVSALIALCSLAVYGSLRLLRWAVAFACIELIVAVTVLMPADRPLLSLFFLLGVVAAAVAIGLTIRIHRMYLAALEERAERLEVERDQRVRLTAAAERSRVAREMHDIVGHNLSVMVGLADGGAVLAASRDEESVETLRLLGDTGRQAMAELRRVLGVLREGSPAARELSPQPAIRDIDALLARVRAAGLAVSYRTTGVLDGLGSGVQLTIYRIVQEALTNTLKHAGMNAAAEVALAVDHRGVRICITDSGQAPGTGAVPDSQPDEDDPGHGVVGIRQRAALYGGSVTIGPRPGADGRGWIVDVVLELSSATGSGTDFGIDSAPAPATAPATVPARCGERRP
jgi:signal transduction histidine kinase